MSSKGSTWGPYVFTRSAYDEQRDAELTYSIWITVELVTTFQKGVYSLTVASRPMLDHESWLRHSVTDTFPSSHAVTFEALLYQTIHKLVRMIENAAQDNAGRATRPPKWG